jgi:hypothetical protein
VLARADVVKASVEDLASDPTSAPVIAAARLTAGHPGSVLVTAGAAATSVVSMTDARAVPVTDSPFDKSGHQPRVIFAETVGQTLYPASNPSGLKVIKEVRFAGELESGSESGSVASFAVGVDRQRPFAVSSFVDEDSNIRVIVIRVVHPGTLRDLAAARNGDPKRRGT